jgi:hypothetical protein
MLTATVVRLGARITFKCVTFVLATTVLCPEPGASRSGLDHATIPSCESV